MLYEKMLNLKKSQASFVDQLQLHFDGAVHVMCHRMTSGLWRFKRPTLHHFHAQFFFILLSTRITNTNTNDRRRRSQQMCEVI